jgi:hypothetical protein
MKQVENYKPRIREKCRVCKVYLPKNCLNDICLKCSISIAPKSTYVSWRELTQG